MSDCPDCGRAFAVDAEEWRDCDAMREVTHKCGARLGDMDSDETIPDCQRATILFLRAQLAQALAKLAASERDGAIHVEALRMALAESTDLQGKRSAMLSASELENRAWRALTEHLTTDGICGSFPYKNIYFSPPTGKGARVADPMKPADGRRLLEAEVAANEKVRLCGGGRWAMESIDADGAMRLWLWEHREALVGAAEKLEACGRAGCPTAAKGTQ